MTNFKLPSKFTFWLQEGSTVKYELYSESLKSVITLTEIRQFWQFFQFLKKPSDLSSTNPSILDCDMYFFKEGIKPLWQDSNNVGGGFLRMRINKQKTNRLWQNSTFSLISPKNRYIEVMNGIRIKIRDNYDEIELWMNKGIMDKDKAQGVKNYLKENMQITDQRAFNIVPFASKK